MSERDGAKVREPLTADEVTGLWRLERRAIRLYVTALSILASGFGVVAFTHVPGEFRYLVLLVGMVLIGGALYVQLAIRCPRCGSRLAVQSALLLPDYCKGCGVAISRPARLDTELDV